MRVIGIRQIWNTESVGENQTLNETLFCIYKKIFHTKNIPGRAHLVVFHWFYKGWSHFRPFFGRVLAKWDLFFWTFKNKWFVQKKMIWLIQLRAGLPARPSPHFVIFEDSENGKVQEVSPKGIYKGNCLRVRKSPFSSFLLLNGTF